jgi:hypothetical protein
MTARRALGRRTTDAARRGLLAMSVAMLMASCSGNRGDEAPPTTTATTINTTVSTVVPATGSTSAPFVVTTSTAPTGPAASVPVDGAPVLGPPPPTAATSPEAAQVEAGARQFLGLYWAPPGGMTWGQLADAAAPVATPELLAPYRDPSQSSLPAGLGLPVTIASLTVTDVRGPWATVSARGTRADGGVVWRTLGLIRDAAGWKVGAIQ